MGVQYESIVQFYFSHSSGLILQTVIFHLSIMMKPIMTVRKLTIGMFLGVPLIPMVMEIAQITWANCEVPKECVFPTTYRGKLYYKCTFVDNDGYPWCNTTDGGWGNCDRSLCEVEKNELGYWQKDLSDPDN